MGIKFGEIDSSQILNNEFKIKVLERILEWILNKNNSLIKPSQQDIIEIRENTVKDLRKKYPDSGINLRR